MKTFFFFFFSALASFALGQIDIKSMYSAEDDFYKPKNTDFAAKNSILPTSDTCYIILSKTDTITKFDKNNKIIWQKKFTAQNESTDNIALTDDGGMILFGETKSKKNERIYQLKRIDNHQNILWVKNLPILQRNYTINDIGIDHNNEIVLIGNYQEFDKNNKKNAKDENYVDEGFIIKCDAKGDTIWSRKYGEIGFYSCEQFRHIYIDEANNVFVLGEQEYVVPNPDKTKTDLVYINPFILQYNNMGHIVWSWTPKIKKNYDVTAWCRNKENNGWGLLFYESVGFRSYTVIAHVDDSGEFRYQKKIPRTTKFDHDGLTIMTNLDGNYLVAGLKSKQEVLLYVPRLYMGETDIWLFEVDAQNGKMLWEKTYGTEADDNLGCFIQLADTSYILIGEMGYTVGDAPKAEDDDDYRYFGTTAWIIRFKELTSQKGRLARMKDEYEIQKKMPKPKVDSTFQRKGNVSGVDSLDFEYIIQNLDNDEIDWDKALKTDYEEYKKVPRIWAVVVGVSDYSDVQNAEGLADLSYAHSDAQAVYNFLRSPQGGAVPESQMQLIINEKATSKEILAAAEKLFSKAASKDLIIFYFSGHGEVSTFLTYDSDLSHTDLKNIISKSAAGQRLCIADACHSGSWLGRKRYVKEAANDEELRRMYYENLRIGSDRIALFMSTGYNQLAYEARGEVTQGIFTHFYLKGLSGEADANRDNIVSLQELYEYVKGNVFAKTASNKPPQVPQLQGVFDNMMPIGVVKKK
jgi:hypothetical protein